MSAGAITITRLIAPIHLTVRVIDGHAELDLTGAQIDPRTLDPTQPENRIDCRVPIELAPDWARRVALLSLLADALGEANAQLDEVAHQLATVDQGGMAGR